jgi:hypothetical protein
MNFEPIQPVVITPFKRELIISSHLFKYLLSESDSRGISPSETARRLILNHLGLSSEGLLYTTLQSRIGLHRGKSIEITQEEMLINILANALTIIELRKGSKLQCQ